MKSYTLTLTAVETNNNQTIILEKIYLKGTTNLTILLNQIPELSYKVNELSISWGDGSRNVNKKRDLFFNYENQSIFDEILYGKLGGSVLGGYSHIYSNDTDVYQLKYSIKIKMVRDSGSIVSFLIPIGVIIGSYYDDIQDLNVLNSQILSNSTNNTFLNLESKADKTVMIGFLIKGSN